MSNSEGTKKQIQHIECHHTNQTHKYVEKKELLFYECLYEISTNDKQSVIDFVKIHSKFKEQIANDVANLKSMKRDYSLKYIQRLIRIPCLYYSLQQEKEWFTSLIIRIHQIVNQKKQGQLFSWNIIHIIKFTIQSCFKPEPYTKFKSKDGQNFENCLDLESNLQTND